MSAPAYVYYTHSDCPHRPGNVVGAAAYGPMTEDEASWLAASFCAYRNGEDEVGHVVDLDRVDELGLSVHGREPGDQGFGWTPCNFAIVDAGVE